MSMNKVVLHNLKIHVGVRSPKKVRIFLAETIASYADVKRTIQKIFGLGVVIEQVFYRGI